ncbi:MAG: hypothetical protein INR66_18670 [Gordonia polyisoprenivorans]|nr:hypothetical protein [Gordonia polyisoprenivorans]
MGLDDDVRATVLRWDERPALREPGAVCALVVCRTDSAAKLYVNDTVQCDHQHLALDANALIDAFAAGDIDGGWDKLANGDFITFIATRQAAREAGQVGWPSPPRNARP